MLLEQSQVALGIQHKPALRVGLGAAHGVEPLAAFGRFIVIRLGGGINAADLDISDGLAGDLRHILAASRVGAELFAASIPVSREARLAAKAGSAAKPALLAALTDGEDFELLFTVASRDAVPLLDAWRKQFPKLPLTCIGKIKAGEGVTIRDKNNARPLTAHGYEHFA